MMDFKNIMKMKGAWDTFSANHPKLMPFMQAVGKNAIGAGTIIEIKVQSPDGKEYATNMKLTESDMELFGQIKNMY